MEENNIDFNIIAGGKNFSALLSKIASTSPEAKNIINENKLFFERLFFDHFVLKTLLDNIPDAIYFKNRDSVFVKVSKVMESIFKLKDEQEILGKTDFDIQDAKHAEEAFNDEQEIMRTGNPLINIVEAENQKDGSIRWVSTTKLPLKGENKEIIGVFGISRDITDMVSAKEELQIMNDELTAFDEELRQNIEELQSMHEELEKQKQELAQKNELISMQNKALEKSSASLEQKVLKRTKQLLEAKNKAEESDKLKSTFLANMSHEIRTPMNSIIGFSDLALNIVQESMAQRYINNIRSSGKSLLSLINDILDLSKIEAGKLNMNLELIETYNFFEEIKSMFKQTIKESNLNFDLIIQEGMPQGLLIDENRLRQILINIISNAIKFTNQGFVKLEIAYTLKKAQEKSDELLDLELKVSDSGIGISKDFQDNIFESFTQQDSRNVKKYEGTGLGLTITKKLVELMNGTIKVDSVLNEGTTFTVNIPDVAIAQFFQLKKEKKRIDYRGIILKPATILIVDDVEFNRDYIEGILQETDLNVVFASDGLQAYQLICELKPNLVLTDIKMPLMDGFGLLDKIKGDADLENIPIVAITATAMKSEQEKIKAHGFDSLLIKPFEIYEFYELLIDFLEYELEGNTEIAKNNEPLLEVKLPEKSIIELSTILKEDMFKEWETFKEQQPMDEVEDFSNKLLNLAKEYPDANLIAYGNKLKTAVNEFDIVNLLKYINEYPSLIQNIESDLK